jgi:hypothetical protein
MKHARSFLLLFLLLLVVGTAAPVTAFAAPSASAPKPKALVDSLVGQARANYDSGRVLFADGDHGGAIVKFQAAYEASKDPRLLWNIAACEKSLRHYARAVGLLKRYRDEGGGVTGERERQDAIDLIKTLEPFTISLTIEATEPGADIEIDDLSVGKSPLPAPLVVDIGQRRIRARKDGFHEVLLTTSVGGSPEQTIQLKLEKESHEGVVRIEAASYARVVIDGVALAKTAVANTDSRSRVRTTDVTLKSGLHTIRVMATGMREFERQVTVIPNETIVLRAQLDFASEEQGWGATQPEPVPKAKGCGCEVVGPPARPWTTAVLAGLATCALARRRRLRASSRRDPTGP